MASGPQISRCSNSNLVEAWDELLEMGNFLCLAKWQMSQTALLSTMISGYNLCIWYNLWWDKWPSLKCHKADKGMEELETEILLMDLLQWEIGESNET